MFTGWWSWRGGRGRWGESERGRRELAQENGHGARDQVLGFLFDGSILCLVGHSEFDGRMIDFILTVGVEPHVFGKWDPTLCGPALASHVSVSHYYYWGWAATAGRRGFGHAPTGGAIRPTAAKLGDVATLDYGQPVFATQG